jgi:glycosyltransferase involved in cell wall biosynthesis
MKLAFYTDSFFPELGGIQDSIETMVRALGDRGHRLLVVAPRPSRRDFRVAGLTPTELDLGSGVRIERLPALPLPGSTGQTRLALPAGAAWRVVADFRPDLIHLQTFLTVGRLGARHARRLRVPILGTNHWAADGFGLYAPKALEHRVARLFMSFVVRFYRQCPIVTTPSRATADAMRRGGFEGQPLVVSNPIDTARFCPVDDQTRSRLRAELGLTGPTLIYAGRLAIEKKVEVVFEALRRLVATHPDLTLAVAGHGTDRERLSGLIPRLGLGSRVRMLGSLPHPELARWLQASDLFVIASTSESQCMALLQAMACGRPAVVADSRALPEVLGSEAGLVARADDPGDFARQIGNLLADAALASRCAEAGIARARRSSITAVTEQWEALYEQLVRVNDARDDDRHPGTQRGGLPRAVP